MVPRHPRELYVIPAKAWIQPAGTEQENQNWIPDSDKVASGMTK